MDNNKARIFAIRAHGSQMYGDKPYIYHLEKVVEMVDRFGFPEYYKDVAYLHDTIEDTDVAYFDIYAKFSRDIADKVFALTEDKNETYFDYIMRIKNEGDDIKAIKVCDLLCNLEECLKDGDKPHLVRKYEKALEILTGDKNG